MPLSRIQSTQCVHMGHVCSYRARVLTLGMCAFVGPALFYLDMTIIVLPNNFFFTTTLTALIVAGSFWGLTYVKAFVPQNSPDMQPTRNIMHRCPIYYFYHQ